MINFKLYPSPFQLRCYRPAVAPVHQEKILAIRSTLASQGVATGRSRAKRNGLTGNGIEGVSMSEAIERLREADLKWIKMKNETVTAETTTSNGKTSLFGHNSLLLNAQVKLLKEQ